MSIESPNVTQLPTIGEQLIPPFMVIYRQSLFWVFQRLFFRHVLTTDSCLFVQEKKLEVVECHNTDCVGWLFIRLWYFSIGYSFSSVSFWPAEIQCVSNAGRWGKSILLWTMSVCLLCYHSEFPIHCSLSVSSDLFWPNTHLNPILSDKKTNLYFSNSLLCHLSVRSVVLPSCTHQLSCCDLFCLNRTKSWRAWWVKTPTSSEMSSEWKPLL